MREYHDWNKRKDSRVPPEKLREILGEIYLPDDADEIYKKLMEDDDEKPTET